MKKILLFACATFSLITQAQIKFEKGFIINNGNIKTECLIKNEDWKNSPTFIEYKLTETGAIKRAALATIKEFSVFNSSHYKRFTVEFDKSSDYTNKLSNYREFSLVKETVFLKYLVKGEASLLLYQNGNLRKYFFVKNDSDHAEFLRYKRYISNGDLHKNAPYKQQLWNHLKCLEASINDIDKIEYNSDDLSRYVVKYNRCHGFKAVDFNSDSKKDYKKFNISIRPGIKSSSVKVSNSLIQTSTDFNNEIDFRLGIEAEYILPFNNNKWGVFLEPTFQSYKSQVSVELVSTYPVRLRRTEEIAINYSSIELPIGLRHYIFFNDHSKLFINLAYTFDFAKGDSKVQSINLPSEVNLRTNPNLVFGLGYKYKNKYIAEFRVATPRNLTADYFYWDVDYNTIALILGYTVF